MELLSFICALVCISSYATVNGNTWTQKRKHHKPKALTNGRVERLVTDKLPLKDFQTYLKPLLVERVSGTPANKAVREYIMRTMKDIGFKVTTDEFVDKTPYGEKEFANVIATHDPTAARRLVLACHFDSKYFKNFVFLAATDSAVPCAMMIDIARVLKPFLDKSKLKDVTLQLLFLDGEEAFVDWTEQDSLYGSRHLADIMHKKLDFTERETKLSDLERMDVFILLDLIGNKGVKFRNWFPDETSRLYERLQKIEQRLKQNKLLVHPTGTYFTPGLFHGSGIQDDHIPFQRKGVPVLHLIAYPFPDTWHNINDDEKHLDYETIGDLIKILRVFVAEYLHLSP